MSTRKVGVLVMSYGTPESMEQIEEYYTHIRRGRPPAQEQLDDLISRYEAIVGGFFPLRKNTDNQVQALEAMLNAAGAMSEQQIEFVCYQGLKHARPYIEDGVEQMVRDGIKEAVGIVLAPHYSSLSVGDYNARAQRKAEELGLEMSFVESYHLHPQLLEALCQRIANAFQKFEGVAIEDIRVLFSAHSLPKSILKTNDPYPEQLLETSRAIVARTGIKQWEFAWQSAGNTPVPWLGPDILDVLRRIKDEGGVRHILVCPIGFVSDHLEVLYDIDIECQALCRELDLHLERTASLNIDPLYMEALADSIRGKL